MTAVTSHRLTCGHHELRVADGTVVGRAWRWPGRARGFGLSLEGIYWRAGNPSINGGITTTSCKTLRDCRNKASTVLDIVRAIRQQELNCKPTES